MSLITFSKFYFGHTVTSSNCKINFKEGVPELTATLNIGSYSLTEYAAEIKRAMDAAGALTYTVAINRTTRVITISAGSNFQLLTSTGSNLTISAFTMIGFTGSDRTGASTYAGNTGSGSTYTPQFILQSHISSEDWQQAVDAVVNKSASAKVEVVSFGTEKFVQLKIRFANNLVQPTNGPIRTNLTGVTDLETFIKYLITKAPIEYMPDESAPSTFQKLILEKTEESQNGTGYKLKEIPRIKGYFDTSVLTMRVIE